MMQELMKPLNRGAALTGRMGIRTQIPDRPGHWGNMLPRRWAAPSANGEGSGLQLAL
jgi:hypothetical protein